MNEILKFLLIEPNLFTDYKNSYKYPFLACEVFCLNSNIIIDYIYSLFENQKPVIFHLLSHLITYSDLNEQSRDSTLPGYLERIIKNSIQHHSGNFFNFLNLHFNDVRDLLLNNIDSDNVKEIIFQILTLNTNQIDLEKSFLSNDNVIQCKLNLIKEIFILLENTLNIKEPSKLIMNKVSNSLYLLIKVLKFMFRMDKREIQILIAEIIKPNNLKIIENLIFEKSDHKMSDSSINLSQEDIQYKIRYCLLFYFNFTETLLVKTEKMEDTTGKDSITSSLFNEEIFMSLSSTTSHSNIDQQTSTEQLQNEELEKIEKLEKSSLKSIPNLYNLITPDQQMQLISYFINIFNQIFEIANRIKNLSRHLKIENSNKSFITPVSQEYLIFLDIFILLLSIKEQAFTKNLESMLYIFHILIDDIIHSNYNEFLSNKILKIFEIIFTDKIYYCISFHLFEMESNKLIRKLVSQIDFRNYLDMDSKKFKSKYSSTNKAHLIKLIELYLKSFRNVEKHKESSCKCNDKMEVDLQDSNEQNKIIQGLYLDFDLKLSMNEFDIEGVEEFLRNYNFLTSTSLLAEQVQCQLEIKNAGDEIIKSDKNCIYIIILIFSLR